ncbi:MAG TPA: DUF4385 domain-containing protein [Verrucomicrobiae bacterium]|nr:DUF4385 domain-containing protein [Verrucomicrobiae bacterium]
MATKYIIDYQGIDFRKHPEKYKIGRGEQGVLMAEPYKSEILPYWKFRTPEIATQSAEKIYTLFKAYLAQNDFVGADMARKFLQMGWTRARRYANHPSGKKHDAKQKVIAQDSQALTSDKAQSAAIFKDYYDRARQDKEYLALKKLHLQIQTNSPKPKHQTATD